MSNTLTSEQLERALFDGENYSELEFTADALGALSDGGYKLPVNKNLEQVPPFDAFVKGRETEVERKLNVIKSAIRKRLGGAVIDDEKLHRMACEQLNFIENLEGLS